MNSPNQPKLISIVIFALCLFAALTVFAQDRRANAEKDVADAELLRKQQTAESQKAAIKKYEAAVLIWHEINEKAKEAESFNSIGVILQESGDAVKSNEYLDKAIAIASTIGDKSLEADVLLTLGQNYDHLGDPKRSIESVTKALTIAREINNKQLEAIAVVTLGFTADATGDKQGALNYYNQALPLVRAIDDKRGEASVLINLGSVYYSLGDLPRAIDLFQQSLPIIGELGDDRRLAIVYNNIGAGYDVLADKPKAIEYYEKGLALRKKIGDRLGEASVLGNMAGAYDELGDKTKSLELYGQSLAIIRELKARGREATMLSNIGRLYFNMHDNDKAFDYFMQSLPIRREVGDIFGEAKTLSNLAAVEKARGNFTDALRWSNETLAIFDSVRASLASQEVRSAYFASVQEYYRFQIDLLMAMHAKDLGKGFDALALQTSEQSRARGLLDTLSEARLDIRQGIDPALLERERALQKDLAEKDKERRSSTGPKADAAEKDIQRIATAYSDLQAEIRTKSPRYASLTQPRSADLADIRKMLDADTLLLEYSLGKDRSFLWVVSQNSIKSFTLPKGSEIDAKAKVLYESTKKPEMAADSQKAAAELGKMLIEPAAAELGNKRLAIVTDGALGYVPFAALTAGTANPLIVDHEVTYLPSASTLAVLRSDGSGRIAPTKTVAVIADPVFDANDTRVGKTATPTADMTTSSPLAKATRDAGISGTLPRLPGTRREAATILSFVPENERKRAIDFDANLAAVNDPGLGQYRIIHFATHGLLNSVHPELSGIVLSLVDKTGKPQNGFLRLNDIYNLRLPADLIVLSACQTALGKEVRGEGLIGLTRGFMYAGARRIVASQWAVDDQATSELMKLFYQGMLGEKKLRPAAALREAQIALLKTKRFSAPYYWSAFTIQGEWK